MIFTLSVAVSCFCTPPFMKFAVSEHVDRDERLRPASRQLFATPNGSLLSDAQRAAINGPANSNYCNTWVTSFLPQFLPTNSFDCGAGFPASIVYGPALRRNGVRCDTDDGPQEPQWGTFVDSDGKTKTKLPYDNVGVQYDDNVGMQYGRSDISRGMSRGASH
jgi:hypothetical protein